MYKTIILSVLIIVVINYIIHFLKNSFTEPILRYIPERKTDVSMKDELSNFLLNNI